MEGLEWRLNQPQWGQCYPGIGGMKTYFVGPWCSVYSVLPDQVDGWTNLQEELDKRKFTISRAFTILFILLASFIFLNMFVGVMIMHTEVRMCSVCLYVCVLIHMCTHGSG